MRLLYCLPLKGAGVFAKGLLAQRLFNLLRGVGGTNYQQKKTPANAGAPKKETVKIRPDLCRRADP